MNKKYIHPVEMLKIAAQHAYCAEHLLKENAEIPIDEHQSVDALLPITSLIYVAFELTLKAYLIFEDKPARQYKSLLELIEMNGHLSFSKEEIHIMTLLSRQQAFRKGVDPLLWEGREQLHIFCEQALNLFEQLEEFMPLELQSDYQTAV